MHGGRGTEGPHRERSALLLHGRAEGRWNMAEKAVRDITLMKGGTFTVQFIICFDKACGEVTRSLKKSGKDLKKISIVSR